MLYFVVITVVMLLTEVATVTVSFATNLISLTYAIIAPIFVNFYVILVLGFFALTMRFVIPKKFWKVDNKLFRVTDKEIKFLNKIKIKSWKDKIPEMGWTAGFSKSKISSLNKEYLEKFLYETRFAEAMHFTVAVLSFTVLFFFRPLDYYFVFPILITNFILNILPCIVQRYNRHRLTNIYRLKYLQWEN